MTGAYGLLPFVLTGSLAAPVALAAPAHAAVRRPGGAQAAPTTGTGGAVRYSPAPAPEAPGHATAHVSVAAASARVPHDYTVVSGDTVSGIAARYGLSTARVLARNGLSWSSLIFPGQVLRLTDATPAPSTTPVAHRSRAAHPSRTVRYTVVRGDTVSGIAAAHGLDTDAVLTANDLGPASIIYPGQELLLPGLTIDVAAAPAPVPRPEKGEIVELTDEMRRNARVIVRVGRALGVGDRGLVVALTAAAQESGLRNVDYGDRDSVGLFQQRPSTGWGAREDILDPVYAARAFFGGPHGPNVGRAPGLLDIPDRRRLTIAQAAQAVQVSAYPDAYADWVDSARAWLASIG